MFRERFISQLLGRRRTISAALFTTVAKRPWGGSTIYALSSGHGKCGVAVVRVSGDTARQSLQKMTRLQKLEPRRTFLRKIYDPDTADLIDKGLCLWFPGPNSFTGEDCVEFHVHGGPAVLSSLMSALSKLKFRLAQPGEFTRRAFYNNKLDLTEIEGLADLIHAETEQQRRQAILQADGSLSKLYSCWRKVLLTSMANLEASIDFGEVDNLNSDALEECNRSLRVLVGDIEAHLSDGRKGEILRSGVRTVIVGEPNVGKSSLLNRLVLRNAAIVTPVAGTTRDVIEVPTNISGYPVILADTAGIAEHTEDEIEIEGIQRAKERVEKADFVVLLVDATRYLKSNTNYEAYINNYIRSLDLNDLLLRDGKPTKEFIVVVNKIDLLDTESKEHLRKNNVTMISCAMEEGLYDLLQSMTNSFQQLCGNPSSENPTISQTRYRIHLKNCLEHVYKYFRTTSTETYDTVIAVEEIRLATRELGKITGHIDTEEVLDMIFQNFCIGK